jgi:hypothetical protein
MLNTKVRRLSIIRSELCPCMIPVNNRHLAQRGTAPGIGAASFWELRARPKLPKDIADSPAALIALAGQNDSDGLLGQFKRGAQIIIVIMMSLFCKVF